MKVIKEDFLEKLMRCINLFDTSGIFIFPSVRIRKLLKIYIKRKCRDVETTDDLSIFLRYGEDNNEVIKSDLAFFPMTNEQRMNYYLSSLNYLVNNRYDFFPKSKYQKLLKEVQDAIKDFPYTNTERDSEEYFSMKPYNEVISEIRRLLPYMNEHVLIESFCRTVDEYEKIISFNISNVATTNGFIKYVFCCFGENEMCYGSELVATEKAKRIWEKKHEPQRV